MSVSSVESTMSCSDKSSIGNDNALETETKHANYSCICDDARNTVVLMAIVELDGLFDENVGSHVTFDNTSNTFITKIRIYRSEVAIDEPPMSSSDVVSSIDHPTFYYTYTAKQLRNKVRCHFAGRATMPSWWGSDENPYQIYIYSNERNDYVPLPDEDEINVVPLFGTRWRIRVRFRNVDGKGDCTTQENVTTPLLAIQGRYFDHEIQADGTITVSGYNVVILPTSPSTMDAHASTGYHIWDAAILLIRYMESEYKLRRMDQTHRVLELGSGCGAVGMTAALLGATSVTVTDLPEILPFLRSNVNVNLKTIQNANDMCVAIICTECDWTQPLSPEIKNTMYDTILIADCIWIEALVVPLFATLRELTDVNAHRLTNQSMAMKDCWSSSAPDAIMEDEIGSDSALHLIANNSISHMDLEKSKSHTDESPVNSNADIYQNQSSQQLSLLNSMKDMHHSYIYSMDQSSHLNTNLVKNSDKPVLTSSTNNQTERNLPLQQPPPSDSAVTVLISYQKRGKSTHDAFIRELYASFTVVESVTVPNLAYPHDVFYLFSCHR
jgi:Lysine methyltransferase